MSDYNHNGKSILDLLINFNKRYPGYKQILEYQDLLNEAEKLKSWDGLNSLRDQKVDLVSCRRRGYPATQ